MRLCGLVVAIALASGAAAHGQTAQGIAELRRAAEQGEAEAQFDLGRAYERGFGVPQDYVEAHKWMNIAAARATGELQKDAADSRELIAKGMTAEQIADAQKRAREWTKQFDLRNRDALGSLAPPPLQAPVRVGGDMMAPTKIKDVTPVYPAIAQSAKVQGVVIIEAIVGPDGRVQDATVLRSIPLLDQAALDAVRQWEYTQTLLNGVPVPVIMTVTVNFSLQ
jgi:TonB family protein